MNVQIEEGWKKALAPEFEKDYFVRLTDFVRQEYQQTTVYPPGRLIFNAFNLCPFDKVKVVIIGQDPYHGPGQAHGLCFSVNDGFIQVCIDSQSNVVATIDVGGTRDWTELAADLDEVVCGVHDIYFRFRATDTSKRNELMQFDYWYFLPQTVSGVESVKAEGRTGVAKPGLYDLSGRRVVKPGRGIYIKDGKKYVGQPF